MKRKQAKGKKLPTYVYVVVENCIHISTEFVKIYGIFRSREAADKYRYELFDSHKIETRVSMYHLLDENGPVMGVSL